MNFIKYGDLPLINLDLVEVIDINNSGCYSIEFIFNNHTRDWVFDSKEIRDKVLQIIDYYKSTYLGSN